MITISGSDVALLKQLGEGTYGSVYLININNKNQAIKIITGPNDEGVSSLKELDIMSRVLHSGLVQSNGISVNVGDAKTLTTVGIIMPLAQTDLQKLLTLASFTPVSYTHLTLPTTPYV